MGVKIPSSAQAGGYVEFPTAKKSTFTKNKIEGITVYQADGFQMVDADICIKRGFDVYIRLVPKAQKPSAMTTKVNGKTVSVAQITVANRKAMFNGQVIATVQAGGALVAAGGGNLVAAGGGNLVAAGGGNMVAAGGGNLVAAGGGNLVAAGGGNLVAAGGGNLFWKPPG